PYLESLLTYHEKNNVLRNVRKCEVVEGDAAKTAPKYFKAHPETIVALAYFDMALYEPTKACLKAIMPCLVPGSVVMLDELNSRDYPGETVAFKELFADRRYTLHKSRFMTDRSYLVIQ
ncbi:MAG: crotonobetainyl-CoA--carnitine CoA-transferase, partial [Pseudomonadota bacterium]|nr:crotonobetainyl-CoA--carnitine CoA-transferase [Pseudomonadota bacterium]